MTRGMYAAAGGMLVGMRATDVYANNLANVSTNGYKADRVSFGSFQRVPLPGVKDANGQDVLMAQSATVNPIGYDFGQGALQETGNPLDAAIEGSGFFTVQTPAGLRYTRDGHFDVDRQGRLTTTDGLPLLSSGGGTINVGGGNVVIQTDGEENASRENSWADLKALVAEKERAGWDFVFMGCGIDAYAQGAQMGIAPDRTMAYRRAPAETGAAFEGLAEATVALAAAPSGRFEFLARHKERAGDEHAPGWWGRNGRR